MGDDVRRGSLQGGLSQLKRFSKIYPFFTKKGFSHFTFIVLSVVVTFPALPEIDIKELMVSSETVSDGRDIAVVYQEELCRWQKDFSFFSDLMKAKKTPGQSAPCSEETLEVRSAAVVSQPVKKNAELDALIREMASGYPIEVMTSAIAEYDRSVAALLVGIAKKESNWGKRVPLAPDGTDCYNYWGFKGAGSRGVAMGHGCFGSPEEAVRAVGNRVAELVDIKQTSEPKNMIIWKCGSSCATHSPESVRKWISDVDLYYRKIALKQ
ncbi:MAG: hypothetical protein Q8O53_03875 [Candidatus Moranbacteria bacterium]|nr:hypothetical protein [Candidatus Moranbacteria bacterium]